MPSNTTLTRYIWLVDTIRRHGSIRRTELNNLWLRSAVTDGQPITRRTFYNYRNAIEEIFGINIQYNPKNFEYYIEDSGDSHAESVTDWMINSISTSNVLSDARDISHLIFVDDIPSARLYLAPIVNALREHRVITFSYSPYTRSGSPKKTTIEPYFLKCFKLRWYITGRNVKEDTVKTYALDRITDLAQSDKTFEAPTDFNAEAYSRDSFGIIFSQGEPKKVVIRADARQAKYFRTLPLHHSQTEMFTDSYSLFTYHLRLTPDFVQELLSYGPNITVLSPPELRAMMVDRLSASLQNYTNDKPLKPTPDEN